MYVNARILNTLESINANYGKGQISVVDFDTCRVTTRLQYGTWSFKFKCDGSRVRAIGHTRVIK